MSIAMLEARVRALEDMEAIRALKAHYFLGCDSKNPQAIRDCFLPGEVLIDYGAIGIFRNRDELAELFTRMACHEHIVEMHHGVNPIVTLDNDNHAHGIWGLFYHQINTRDRIVTQLGARYEDEYCKIDGAWKIATTRCVVTSTLVSEFSASPGKLVFGGARFPAQENA